MSGVTQRHLVKNILIYLCKNNGHIDMSTAYLEDFVPKCVPREAAALYSQGAFVARVVWMKVPECQPRWVSPITVNENSGVTSHDKREPKCHLHTQRNLPFLCRLIRPLAPVAYLLRSLGQAALLF